MRNSIDGLFGLIQRTLSEDPYSGHLFVFVSKKRDRVQAAQTRLAADNKPVSDAKILGRDGQGMGRVAVNPRPVGRSG